MRSAIIARISHGGTKCSAVQFACMNEETTGRGGWAHEGCQKIIGRPRFLLDVDIGRGHHDSLRGERRGHLLHSLERSFALAFRIH